MKAALPLRVVLALVVTQAAVLVDFTADVSHSSVEIINHRDSVGLDRLHCQSILRLHVVPGVEDRVVWPRWVEVFFRHVWRHHGVDKFRAGGLQRLRELAQRVCVGLELRGGVDPTSGCGSCLAPIHSSPSTTSSANVTFNNVLQQRPPPAAYAQNAGGKPPGPPAHLERGGFSREYNMLTASRLRPERKRPARNRQPPTAPVTSVP